MAGGGVEAILTALSGPTMSSAPSTEQFDVDDVVYDGCRALETLAEDPRNRAELAARGAVETIICAMTKRAAAAAARRAGHEVGNGANSTGSSPPDYLAYVQDSAAGALAELAKLSSNRARIAQAGGAEAIVEAMRSHSSDEDLQKTGCYALGELCRDGEGRFRVCAARGPEAVFAALGAHPRSSTVQQAGLWMLALLAEDPGGTGRAQLYALADNGPTFRAARVAVDAMMTHPNDTYVQSNGAWVLSKLARDPKAREAMGRARSLRRPEGGAICALLRALAMRPADAAVHNCVCFALAELSKHRTNAALIARGGGLLAMMAAVRQTASEPLRRAFPLGMAEIAGASVADLIDAAGAIVAEKRGDRRKGSEMSTLDHPSHGAGRTGDRELSLPALSTVDAETRGSGEGQGDESVSAAIMSHVRELELLLEGDLIQDADVASNLGVLANALAAPESSAGSGGARIAPAASGTFGEGSDDARSAESLVGQGHGFATGQPRNSSVVEREASRIASYSSESALRVPPVDSVERLTSAMSNREHARILAVSLSSAILISIADMTARPADAYAQCESCHDLGRLAREGVPDAGGWRGFAGPRDVIVRAGGKEAILRAMERHPHDVDVQREAQWALKELGGWDA
jgi:hypothetical protein